MARASGRAKNPDLSGFLQVSGGAPQIPTEGGWVGNATLGWGTYGEPLPTYAITLPVRP